MEPVAIPENVKIWLLIIPVFVIAIIAFWPLMTVFVWAIAVAAVLLPIHQLLCRYVKPGVSATLITLSVVLIILAVMAFVAFLIVSNESHISQMALAMINGLHHTSLSRFVPSFTDAQLSNFNGTLQDLMVNTVLSLTGNTMQTLLSIIIFFLTLSMLLFYGEQIWNRVSSALSPKLQGAVSRLTEITESTIFALIVVQITAAMIAFVLALPFFYFLGYGDVLLFSSLIGFSMLIPLIGAQVMILILALYFFSLGDLKSAAIMLFVGYPLLSGWIDFFYRPFMMGKRVAVHPVIMMIGIFAGVPFMGIVGFILGPVLVALVVVGADLLAEEVKELESRTPPS